MTYLSSRPKTMTWMRVQPCRRTHSKSLGTLTTTHSVWTSRSTSSTTSRKAGYTKVSWSSSSRLPLTSKAWTSTRPSSHKFCCRWASCPSHTSTKWSAIKPSWVKTILTCKTSISNMRSNTRKTCTIWLTLNTKWFSTPWTRWTISIWISIHS
jgi:hypothetical protein